MSGKANCLSIASAAHDRIERGIEKGGMALSRLTLQARIFGSVPLPLNAWVIALAD